MAHQAVDSWAQHLRRTAEALLGLHQQGEEQSWLLSRQVEELVEKRELLAKESALLEAIKADLNAREERLKIAQGSSADEAAECSSAAATRASLQQVLVAALVAQKKSEAPLARVEELQHRAGRGSEGERAFLGGVKRADACRPTGPGPGWREDSRARGHRDRLAATVFRARESCEHRRSLPRSRDPSGQRVRRCPVGPAGLRAGPTSDCFRRADDCRGVCQ